MDNKGMRHGFIASTDFDLPSLAIGATIARLGMTSPCDSGRLWLHARARVRCEECENMRSKRAT